MTESQAFWETETAIAYNRRDRILKELEIREIAKHVRDGMRVLDVGCGDGETGKSLIDKYAIDWWGIDSSAAMLEAANARLGSRQHKGRWAVVPASVVDLRATWDGGPEFLSSGFDVIYSERCLINLPDWPTQEQAIRTLIRRLSPAGRYLMVEHSQDGLDRLNDWRAMVGLKAILVAGHNRYLRETEVELLAASLYGKGTIDTEFWPQYFASTYYILSRVVNAAMAKAEGQEPDYDAFVNQLALKLPNVGNIGHAVRWIWRKP